jgi:putative transposase
VERNPLRAKLVQRAGDWQFGSLWRWAQETEPLPKLLTPWPIPRTAKWIERVNQPLSVKELSALHTCVQRGQPYGDESWTRETAQRTGLDYTFRPRGRPRRRKS